MGLCDDADRILPETLAPLLEPFGSRLGAPTKAHSMLEQWFEIRRRLYEYLLLDRGEFAAKAMLTLAVELAADAKLLGPDDWRLTDEGLLEALHDRSVGEHQTISQIVKRLRVGDLFSCVNVWRATNVACYQHLSESASKRNLERVVDEELAKGFGLRLRVCLHYILDNKKTCRSLQYHDVTTGRDRNVGYDSGSLLIGAFVTNARSVGLTEQERHRASDVIRQALAGMGLTALTSAPEPLGEAPSTNVLFC